MEILTWKIYFSQASFGKILGKERFMMHMVGWFARRRIIIIIGRSFKLKKNFLGLCLNAREQDLTKYYRNYCLTKDYNSCKKLWNIATWNAAPINFIPVLNFKIPSFFNKHDNNIHGWVYKLHLWKLNEILRCNLQNTSKTV